MLFYIDFFEKNYSSALSLMEFIIWQPATLLWIRHNHYDNKRYYLNGKESTMVLFL